MVERDQLALTNHAITYTSMARPTFSTYPLRMIDMTITLRFPAGIKLPSLNLHVRNRVDSKKRAPVRIAWSFAWASVWMLRSTEASAVKWEHVQIDEPKREVKLTIPKSKMDQKALGTKRTLRCCLESPCSRYCSFGLVTELAKERKGDGKSTPLFPDVEVMVIMLSLHLPISKWQFCESCELQQWISTGRQFPCLVEQWQRTTHHRSLALHHLQGTHSIGYRKCALEVMVLGNVRGRLCSQWSTEQFADANSPLGITVGLKSICQCQWLPVRFEESPDPPRSQGKALEALT